MPDSAITVDSGRNVPLVPSGSRSGDENQKGEKLHGAEWVEEKTRHVIAQLGTGRVDG